MMLTRELAIAKHEQGQVLPDRLTIATHRAYLEYARHMIDVYGHGVGKPRWDLHRSVAYVLEQDRNCPIRRVGAFCKLLDEWSTFDRGKPKVAAELRRQVFRMAAQYHPLVTEPESILEHAENKVQQIIATELGMEWSALRERLFSDLIENHRMRRFDPPKDPIELLSRYNVAQTQVAMLDAVSVRIEATADWKWILRYAKLAGLMHRITRTPSGYRFEFDGAASVLRSTHRYGAAMAKFLPGLIACSGWTLTATMRSGPSASPWRGGARLELNDRSGLKSPAHGEFHCDSEVERGLIENWGDERRQGWRLIREGEILHRGQRVFLPDFVLDHRDGRRILFEIAGFWTPEYIAHKAEVLKLFADIPILVAIPKATAKRWDDVPCAPAHRRIVYRARPDIESILNALDTRLP